MKHITIAINGEMKCKGMDKSPSLLGDKIKINIQKHFNYSQEF